MRSAFSYADGASEPIAIVGMSSKFSGDATNTRRLWSMLMEGRSGWTPFPSSRFKQDGVYHPNSEKLNSTHVKGAHFIEEDVGLFDAAFFSYSSETSSSLDPQYRLQLESVYEALENAGIPLASIAGSNTSVFTGVFVHDYRDGLLRNPDNLPRLMATGTGVPMMSNRISHFFDLRGASMTIETACSSGMVAMHQAIQSLRTGEAEMSIVGGANLTLNPDMFKALGSAGFLSGDGKSYAFDSRASGYGRGEGVATIIVKLLKDALAAGDPIQGVIRESLLNQDGKTETITTPSLHSQKSLISGCYLKAGLDPRETQYFEAHGTGTQAGDTVEAQAIASIFGANADPLLIGSIKTNIGHTEAASGLASIIKTAVALEKGIVPATINFENANPQLSLEKWNLKIVQETQAWPEATIRRASINNFGYGGTNAHIIMENAARWAPAESNINQTNGNHPLANGVSPEIVIDQTNGHTDNQSNPDGFKVVVLSARDEQACQTMASNLGDFLEQEITTHKDPAKLLDSVAYTLGERRTRFPWVAAHVVPNSVASVIETLRSPKFKPSRTSTAVPRIGMVFTGQGAQWFAMGRELAHAYPVYQESLQEAEDYLKEFGAKWKLLEELSRHLEVSKLNEVALSTPICVAVQISLVRLLRSWGVVPTAVTSHSSGEIAAAYAAGALSYRAAMSISYHRAALAADPALQGPVKGGMIAVGLGESDAEAYLSRLSSGKAVVACINSPSSTTVAGDVAAVIELESLTKIDNVFARRLKVDTAWHSHHMAPVADAYVGQLEAGRDSADTDSGTIDPVAFSSPVTGGRMANLQNLASPRHWVDSLLQPVQFVAAFTDMVLADRGESVSNVDVIVEIGPHTALGGPIQDIFGLPEFEGLQIPYYGSLVRNKDAQETMLALAANLLRHGCAVDLGAVNFPFGRGRNVKVLTDLPSYPWNHRIKHWVEPRENRALRQRSLPPHNLLGTLVEGCNPDAPSWRHVLRISESPWVRDHMIQSNVVYPAAGYMCLAIEAIRQNSALKDSARAEEATGYSLREVEFMQALLIPESSDGIEIQTTMRLVDDKTARLQGWMRFEVWTVTPDNDWTQHAEGLIMAEYDNSSFERVQRSNTPQDIEGYARRFIPADLFMNLRALGITHGPMFQNMSSIVQSGSSSSSVVTMAIPDTSVPKDPPQDHVLHPVSLDSIITAPYSAMPEVAGRETSAKVPRAVQSFWVSARIRNKAGYTVKVHSSIIHEDEQDMKANVTAFDQQDGTPILEMRSFSYLSLGRALSLSKGEDWQTQWCSNVRWSLDMSFTSPATFAAIKKSLKGGAELDPAEASLTDKIRRVCIYFMQKTLLDLEPRDIQHLEPQHARYYSWMKDVVRNSQSDSIEWRAEDEVEMKRRVVQIARAREDAEMVCHLGPQLTNILRGEMTPLEIMTQNELLFRYQRGTPWLKHVGSQLAELLSHLTHKNPRSRILEIGAGHGALTRYALEVLGTKASGGPQAESYHFTDISDKAFETCQTMFAEWNELLSFHVLDIGHEPAAQGFLTGTYDIVIASHVLLSDQDGTSLINIRGLLKANGVLLATEDVNSQIDNAFVNGLLPGWKFGEQRMKDSPSCHAHWNESLRHAGFAGIQLDLRNGEDINNYTSGVVMTRVAPAEAIIPMHADLEDLLIIISNRAGAPPFTWLESLRQLLSAQDEGGKQKLPTVHDLEFDGATPDWYAGKICIFVGELDEPILYELDAAYLEALRAMSTGCQALLWVTSGGAVDCERPEMSLATGFVRTLRTEYVGRKFVTLDLDPKAALWSDNGISAIAQIVLNCELGKSPRSGVGEERGPQELEFAERDGVILIPRLYHDLRRNKAMSGGGLDSDQLQAVSMEAWLQPDRPLRWNAKKEAFCDDTYAEELHDVLLDHLVEVEPRAYKASLEARDQRITGWDCAGIVTRVGITAAAQGVVVGDRVMCLVGPGQAPLANHTFFDWRAVVAMPKSLTFEEAASLPSAFLSAYFCLVCTARLKPAQKVLIHDASSDVGQAAIMLAQHIGADITAVVDDDKRRSAIARAYAIPSNRIFESEDKSWIVALLEETQGRGVDVVLNTRPIPPPHLIGLVASHGWFVQAGQGGVADDNKQLVSQALTRGISLTAFDASSALEHRGQDVQRCLADIARLFETKALKPDRPITSFGMGEMAKASALLHDEAHVGNVVLMCGSHDTVPVLPPRTTPVLSPSASYLIVGGSGGLGQSVAHWLVARGARNLILMSRNAAKSPHTAALAKELHRAGCDRILPVSCDVANEDDLAQAIHMCAEEGLPPIRGVVHAAFVLRDSFLANMTLDDFKHTTESKIAGAWNLHNQFNLPADLDFFVLFSSINGLLGYPSQAAYSAAGAYEDALAQWRVQQCGLPAVSIDLSVVNGVGYVAEASAADVLRKTLVRAGRRVIGEDHVLAALELAITSPYDPQFVVGGINSGPGPHWDVDGDLGRDMRLLPLRYRQPIASDEAEQQQGTLRDSLAANMSASKTRDEAIEVVGTAIAKMLADMFLVPMEEIDLAQSPSQQGVDSLVAVELRNMLFSQAAAELSIFEFMQVSSLALLAAVVVDRSAHVDFTVARSGRLVARHASIHRIFVMNLDPQPGVNQSDLGSRRGLIMPSVICDLVVGADRQRFAACLS